MKHIFLPFITILPMVLLPLQGQDIQREFQSLSAHMQQLSGGVEYSFEGTTFHYGEEDYDMLGQIREINGIMSATPVGDKIVIECHTGPKNGVYCIFDTESKSFDEAISGNHLIWHDDDITTAVYAFWSEILTYDGSSLKNYELTEGEFIYDLAYADDNTKLEVTILQSDGTEQIDRIDLQ